MCTLLTEKSRAYAYGTTDDPTDYGYKVVKIAHDGSVLSAYCAFKWKQGNNQACENLEVESLARGGIRQLLQVLRWTRGPIQLRTSYNPLEITRGWFHVFVCRADAERLLKYRSRISTKVVPGDFRIIKVKTSGLVVTGTNWMPGIPSHKAKVLLTQYAYWDGKLLNVRKKAKV